MSNVDFQERLTRHRGFSIKAHEVLLEPPASFAVVAISLSSMQSFFQESSGSLTNESVNPKSAHRGFTAKAREMLVERQGQDTHHRLKPFIEAIRTDFDICHKQQLHLNHPTLDDLPIQQANIVYEKKEISIPHSKLSRIKAHKLLGETGRTRSANEIFYDKCMKRVRSPLLRRDLQVASSSYGIPTTTCPDSQRSSASEKANELRDA